MPETDGRVEIRGLTRLAFQALAGGDGRTQDLGRLYRRPRRALSLVKVRKGIPGETNRLRATQEAFNAEHGIEPRTIVKDIASPLLALSNLDYHDAAFLPPRVGEVDVTDAASLAKAISELEKQMKAAAKRLEFEGAAQLRDRIKELRAQQIYKT